MHLEFENFSRWERKDGDGTGRGRDGREEGRELGMKSVEWEEEREGSGREVSIAKVNDSPPPLTSW